jgi:hypothetical protein
LYTDFIHLHKKSGSSFRGGMTKQSVMFQQSVSIVKNHAKLGSLRKNKDCFVVPPRNDDTLFLKLVRKLNTYTLLKILRGCFFQTSNFKLQTAHEFTILL